MSARRIFHRLFLLAALLAPIASAFAQPAPVPALPDAPRQTSYTLNASTCACALNFQLYQDGTDVDAAIEVWLGGARYLSNDSTHGWSLSTMATGGLANAARPITDAVLTFNQVQTGTVVIVGAQRPRRLTEFSENAGVPARAHNQTYNSIVAMLRENWDKTNDLTGRGLFFAPGNTTGPMPAPAACAGNYLAFDLSGLNPVCQPIIGTGSFVGVGQGLQNNSGTISAGPGVDTNTLNNQGGNYTIASSDCGKTVYYGSVGQVTLTLPAVTGFPSNCSVLIKNGDITNGKVLSGFPPSLGTILYPRQSVGVKITNGAWSPFYAPGPWSTTSAVTLFVSASGNNANDGLTSGTPITLAAACSLRQLIFQPNAAAVTIQLADGTYSTPDGNGALCSIEGNSGGTSNTLTLLVGDCPTPSNVVLSIPDGDTGIFTKDLGEVEISCVKFQGAGSGTVIGVSGAQFSVADISNTVWGSFGSGSVGLQISQNASFNLLGTAAATINGNINTFISIGSGGIVGANNATTIAIPSAVAWGGQFIQLYEGGSATLAGMTFTGSGVAGTTGKRATLIGPVFLQTGGIGCNTFFPGNAACTLVNGAQDDANDPATSPIVQAQFAIGGLPTCNSAVQGALAYVTNGIASPTYRQSVSTTGSTLQLVGCDGSGWTYH